MSKPGSGSFLTGNSENLREKRIKNLRPFTKGKSGNLSGRPKKAYLTKIYERILRKAHTRKEIEEAFTKVLTSGRMASVLMAREMAERTEGKVGQEVEISGSISMLSDEELTKRLAKLLEKC